MFLRLVSMRRGPHLGPQRGLVVPGHPLGGRSRLRLLQDPRALCPQISAAWSSVGRACLLPPRGSSPYAAPPLLPPRRPRSHRFTSLLLYFRRGRGSDIPQPAPLPPAIFQIPLGVRVRGFGSQPHRGGPSPAAILFELDGLRGGHGGRSESFFSPLHVPQGEGSPLECWR
ncbi:hypothetical protein NDU88_009717 [Pleurodeles waltl]|uniref:Uncharacterized protein n=1 Tax=Pleurodeles waltl TaxID=8319 RepID=A0AAV7QTL2_PLEWA|nr:hypothetical protein NDU88_009717 [Pleurodeles waltl]